MSPARRHNLENRADSLLLKGRVDASIEMYRQLGAEEHTRRLYRMGNQALASANIHDAVAAFVAAGYLSLNRRGVRRK